VGRRALLAGATGLVGRHVLTRLLESDAYESVTLFLRHEIPLSHPKVQQRVVDFDRLSRISSFPMVDDVFCCLGTTMRKAGSEAAFRRVDLSYVGELARLASVSRARQFLLISAMGADPASRIFYNRVKGEAEEAVRRLGFEGTEIFRPSLLSGRREEKRPGERLGLAVARLLSFAMVGPIRKYRAIRADVVADVMVRVALKEPRGVNVFESPRIQLLHDKPALLDVLIPPTAVARRIPSRAPVA